LLPLLYNTQSEKASVFLQQGRNESVSAHDHRHHKGRQNDKAQFFGERFHGEDFPFFLFSMDKKGMEDTQGFLGEK